MVIRISQFHEIGFGENLSANLFLLFVINRGKIIDEGLSLWKTFSVLKSQVYDLPEWGNERYAFICFLLRITLYTEL